MKELSIYQMEAVTGGLSRGCRNALFWYGVTFISSAALSATVVGGLVAGVFIAKSILDAVEKCAHEL